MKHFLAKIKTVLLPIVDQRFECDVKTHECHWFFFYFFLFVLLSLSADPKKRWCAVICVTELTQQSDTNCDANIDSVTILWIQCRGVICIIINKTILFLLSFFSALHVSRNISKRKWDWFLICMDFFFFFYFCFCVDCRSCGCASSTSCLTSNDVNESTLRCIRRATYKRIQQQSLLFK